MSHLVPIESIRVGERFRKDMGDNAYDDHEKLEGLTDSIKRNGLIHAIVVERDTNILIAGERRLRACRRLGLATIAVEFRDEVDDTTRRELELEENFHRKSMTWQEEARLIAEISRIKGEKYGLHTYGGDRHTPGSAELWSQGKTALSLGISETKVSRHMALARALEVMPELEEEDSYVNALKRLDREIQLVEAEQDRRRLVRDNEGAARTVADCLWLGDACELLGRIPTGSVDLIITDPPYGVDFDAIAGDSNHRTSEDYDDSPEAVLSMLRTVSRELRRVLKDSGHAYFFYGFGLEYQTRLLYSQAGFELDPIPLAWVKNKHGTVDWNYRYAPTYDCIMFCPGNKTRMLAHKELNVFHVVVESSTIHANQKPIELLSKFIEMSSTEGETVLDPFAGSGATAVAAIRLNRRWIAIEKNERIHALCQQRLLQETTKPIPIAEDIVMGSDDLA